MGPKGRGKGWSSQETLSLLDCIERLLPLGGNHWELVQTDYNTRASQENDWIPRDVDSIRRKFKALRNSRKPTGEPDCPIDVVRAKHINRMIESRMAVLDMESDHDGENSSDADRADTMQQGTPQPAPQGSSSLPATPTATPRTGLDPSQLAALAGASANGIVMSQTAQRRRKIDEILAESTDNEAIKRRLIFEQRDSRQAMFEAMMAMDSAREERERVRHEERLRRQEQVDAIREERQSKMDQVLLAVLAKLVDK
ncbi:hypothetical protein AaE_014265 [Aphanomyces astaci]|uniref:DUF6818 domain-containing protein n=1 Tax=Aphanomyces astaci TaxID=112090 RepID=A0A6A4Z4G3_APHAT|nr:hypothetical protein AaE_014265 [Aphanomyces astaci]